MSFLSKGEEDIIVSQSAFFRRRSSPKEHHAHGEDDDDEETIDDGKTPKLLRLLVRDDAVAQTSVSSHRDRGRLRRSSTFWSRFYARCSVWSTRKSTARKLETSTPPEEEEEEEEGITARGDTEGATFTASITTRRRRAREDGKRRDAR